MCGIFAYLNYNVARERGYIAEVLFNGLRRLEYRGYDSAGIAIDSNRSGFVGTSKTAESAGIDRNEVSKSNSISIPYNHPLVFRQEGKIDSLVGSFYEGDYLKK